MGTCARTCLIVGIVAFLVHPALAQADETDNFTCRGRPLKDSLGALDAVMNARIGEALKRVTRREGRSCDASCLFRELQDAIGGSYLHPLTLIPHARFEKWIDERPDIDRCHLTFKESIYGARAYNQPWLFPFTGRIIFVADSIRVSDHVIGIDKINHFIREGLAHWRAVEEPGGEIAAVMRRELGPPGRQWRWNEYGLKGLSLSGVLAYADLAASYSGFRFWRDLLSIDQPGSFVAYDAKAGGFVQRRDFSFAEYVTDAWDEGVNCSSFHPTLAKQVGAALLSRSMSCRATDCRLLATLPQAGLYVNPACVPAAAPLRNEPPLVSTLVQISVC